MMEQRDMVLQRDIVEQAKLSKVASIDACYRVIRKMVAGGEIESHKTKVNNRLSIMFSEEDAEKIKTALAVEFDRRKALLEGEEVEETKDDKEPKTVKDLATAEGPKKRPMQAKKKEGSTTPEKSDFKLPPNLWMWLAGAGVLLLGFGWWRARKVKAGTSTGRVSQQSPQTSTGAPLPARPMTDQQQLDRWNKQFEGL